MATVIYNKQMKTILFHMIDSMVASGTITTDDAATVILVHNIFYDIIDKASHDGCVMDLYIEACKNKNVSHIVEGLEKSEKKVTKSDSELALEELVRALLSRKK